MSLRKRIAVLLGAVMVMGVMSVPPAMATACGGINCGNKAEDGGDKNKGGGQ